MYSNYLNNGFFTNGNDLTNRPFYSFQKAEIKIPKIATIFIERNGYRESVKFQVSNGFEGGRRIADNQISFEISKNCVGESNIEYSFTPSEKFKKGMDSILRKSMILQDEFTKKSDKHIQSEEEKIATAPKEDKKEKKRKWKFKEGSDLGRFTPQKVITGA